MDVTKVLYLKGMVCACCMRVINEDMADLNVRVLEIKLGKVIISYDEEKVDFEKIENVLKINGFSIIEDKERILVEQIKIAVIELIHYSSNNNILRNSDYLVEKIGYSYQYLSSIFSKYEENTLEKYIILNKIEKVKELIEYGEISLSEIAYMMGYSSVQYLSTQFKQITNISVTDYKKNISSGRTGLNEI